MHVSSQIRLAVIDFCNSVDVQLYIIIYVRTVHGYVTIYFMQRNVLSDL